NPAPVQEAIWNAQPLPLKEALPYAQRTAQPSGVQLRDPWSATMARPPMGAAPTMSAKPTPDSNLLVVKADGGPSIGQRFPQSRARATAQESANRPRPNDAVARMEAPANTRATHPTSRAPSSLASPTGTRSRRRRIKHTTPVLGSRRRSPTQAHASRR